MTGKDLRKHVAFWGGASALHLRAIPESSRFIRLAEYSVRFLLAFLLSRATLSDSLSPFGLGFLGASPPGILCIITFIGTTLGYLTAGSFVWSLKYILTGLLIFAAIRVFKPTAIFGKAWFRPAMTAFMTACTGFVYAADAGWSAVATSLFLCEVALAGASVFFYDIALSPWSTVDSGRSDEARHSISVLILLATLLVSLTGLSVFGMISIGRVLAVMLVITTAYKGGSGIGASCGLLVGTAMDFATGNGVFFSLAYAVSGMISGIFSKFSRFIFTVCFILGNAVSVIWLWQSETGPSALYEVFIASVLFFILPKSVLSRAAALLPAGTSGYGILKAREYTKKRVEETAAAFSELYDTVRTVSGADKNDDNIAKVFDRAADAACLKCPKSTRCWRIGYEQTLDVMNNLTPIMLTSGRIEEADFPDFFAETCENLPKLTAAINEELTALMYRRQYKSRLRDNIGAAYNQYADISNVLRSMADELGSAIEFEPFMERRLQRYLKSIDVDASTAVFRDRSGRLHAEISSNNLRALKKNPSYLDKLSAVLQVRLCTSDEEIQIGKLVLLEAEPLAASVGIASIKRHGESVSGDRGIYFKTGEGLLCILLSDGMGTGMGAAECSRSVVSILERFLRAGVPAKTALRILNNLMLLKNDADTTTATIDLLCVSLFTGEAEIYKYGAAPSYIRRGNTVSRIKCRTLAAGLGYAADDRPDHIKMRLEPASFAVIVSDGAIGNSDDKWLREEISNYSGDSPKELAGQLVRRAAEKFGTDDDMTILTLLIEARK
ncbi:MAG: SpoIIE family protein phosphatase [Oscillospiraceae bacterium]